MNIQGGEFQILALLSLVWMKILKNGMPSTVFLSCYLVLYHVFALIFLRWFGEAQPEVTCKQSC